MKVEFKDKDTRVDKESIFYSTMSVFTNGKTKHHSINCKGNINYLVLKDEDYDFEVKLQWDNLEEMYEITDINDTKIFLTNKIHMLTYYLNDFKMNRSEIFKLIPDINSKIQEFKWPVIEIENRIADANEYDKCNLPSIENSLNIFKGKIEKLKDSFLNLVYEINVQDSVSC